MRSGRYAVVAACAVVFAITIAIQQPLRAQTTVETKGNPPPAADADISVEADVHIQSIHYATAPQRAKLKVSGVNQAGGYTITRTNLPAHPKAGATYRNVRIQLHLASRFVDPNAHGAPSRTSATQR